jgi:hypothetical protein
MPEEERGLSRANGDLILDETMIAVERALVGASQNGAARSETALSLDLEGLCPGDCRERQNQGERETPTPLPIRHCTPPAGSPTLPLYLT